MVDHVGRAARLRAGRIWYRTMLSLNESSGFVKTTVAVAATEFGRSSKEHKAVKAEWKEGGSGRFDWD